MEIIAKGFRISLRTLGTDDADELAKNANNHEIAYSVARLGEFPFPYTKEHALYFIASALEKQRKGKEFHFGIRLNGRTIGACALMKVDEIRGQGEVGYWIGKRYWGSGYAREALRLLIGFGFEMLALDSVRASTFWFNKRSINLLGSLGFSEDLTVATPGENESAYLLHKSSYTGAIALGIKGRANPP